MLVTILLEIDYHSWRTWAFLYLALSIGAELAPSDIDLRAKPARIGGIGAAVTDRRSSSHLRELEALAPYRHGFDLHLRGLGALVGVLDPRLRDHGAGARGDPGAHPRLAARRRGA
jgi:hypothetical protein